jgi:hypothetical protein
VSTSAQSCGDFSPSEVSVYYAARAPKVRQRGHEWRGPCPIHGGKNDNFAVNADTGMWYCHSQCGRGGSVFDLEMALTNTEFPTAANETRRIVGRPALRQVDREPEMKWGLPGWSHNYLRQQIETVEQKQSWKHTAIYPYFDADGALAYVKVRFIDKQNDKTFRQFGPTSKLGWKSRKRAGKKPILYRLNTLAAAPEIFIVNGEKAADRGAGELGIVTTCTPDGEGRWLGQFSKALAGKKVRIVIDRDEKGEMHGKVVSEALAPHVAEVKIIRLPGLRPKGDLWDWIEAGGTREELSQIVANAPVVEAAQPAVVTASHESPAQHGPPLPTEHGLLKQLRNDTGNADRLILKFGRHLRYCPAFRKWLVWDGRRWAVDDQGAARRMAKRTMLEYLAEAVDADDRDHLAFAYGSLDARRISNMLTMAECEAVITPEQLDTYPFLLNFMNGTLDLESGKLLPHDPERFITKLVHYDYNPQAECPLFLSFIARVMGTETKLTTSKMARLFQYGSNCDQERLNDASRLGGEAANPRLAQTMEELDIAFNVYSQTNACAASNLTPSPGRHAWGVLYDIPDHRLNDKGTDGKRTMAQIEGPRYAPQKIRVRTMDGQELDATTFLVKKDAEREDLWTSKEYVEHIVTGLRSHDAPPEYVEHVIAIAMAHNERAIARAATEAHRIAMLGVM